VLDDFISYSNRGKGFKPFEYLAILIDAHTRH
jgi:hypothetical protein